MNALTSGPSYRTNALLYYNVILKYILNKTYIGIYIFIHVVLPRYSMNIGFPLVFNICVRILFPS
jgi:hypothetical protein